MRSMHHTNRFKRMRRHAERMTVGLPTVAYKAVAQRLRTGETKQAGEIRLGSCTRRYYKRLKHWTRLHGLPEAVK